MSAETIIVFRIHDIDSVIIIKQNCMIPFWTRIFLQEIHKGFEEFEYLCKKYTKNSKNHIEIKRHRMYSNDQIYQTQQFINKLGRCQSYS